MGPLCPKYSTALANRKVAGTVTSSRRVGPATWLSAPPITASEPRLVKAKCRTPE
jgi:hypothetical protein